MTASARAACASDSLSLYRAASDVTLPSTDLMTSRMVARDACFAFFSASFIFSVVVPSD